MKGRLYTEKIRKFHGTMTFLRLNNARSTEELSF